MANNSSGGGGFNPLGWVRENQKWMMAIFVVMLIILFTIQLGTGIEPLTNLFGGGKGGSSNSGEAVALWTHGTITQGDLYQARVGRRALHEFLEKALAMAQERSKQPVFPKLSIFPTGRQGSFEQQYLNEGAVLRMIVLAKKGEEMGVAIDDATLEAMLLEYVDQKLTADDLTKIPALLAKEEIHVTQRQILDALKKELLQQQVQTAAMLGMFGPNAPATTPAQLWREYRKMNREQTIELVPITAEEFISQVAEPSEAEIKKLFEEAKSRPSVPGSPEAGFARRKALMFQYFTAEFPKFLEAAKKDVTEAQILEYYEKNKIAFKEPELAPSALDKPEPGPTIPETSLDPPEGKPEVKPEPKPGEAPEKKPADPAPEPKPEGAPEKKPADPAPAVPEKKEAPPAKAGEQFIALLQDAPPAEPKAADPAAEKKPDPAPANPPAEKKEPAPANPPPEKKEPAPPADPKPVAPVPPVVPMPPVAEKPVKYKPIEKVRDEILGAVARPMAQARMELALKSAAGEVQKFATSYRNWSYSGADKSKAPAPPDFKAIAAKHGLAFDETKFVDQVELAQTELGKSSLEGEGRFQNFAQTIFAMPYLPRYTVHTSASRDNERSFVSWNIDERKEYVPKLDEVKAEVVAALKRQAAFKLAEKKAAELAEAARQKKGTLRQIDLGGREVKTPTPFRYLFFHPQVGMFPGQVEGVEFAGDDFMDAVFKLNPGEVGVAINTPKTVAYLVRLVSDSGGDAARLEEILGQQGFDSAQRLAAQENYGVASQWLEDVLIKEYQLHIIPREDAQE